MKRAYQPDYAEYDLQFMGQKALDYRPRTAYQYFYDDNCESFAKKNGFKMPMNDYQRKVVQKHMTESWKKLQDASDEVCLDYSSKEHGLKYKFRFWHAAAKTAVPPERKKLPNTGLKELFTLLKQIPGNNKYADKWVCYWAFFLAVYNSTLATRKSFVTDGGLELIEDSLSCCFDKVESKDQEKHEFSKGFAESCLDCLTECPLDADQLREYKKLIQMIKRIATVLKFGDDVLKAARTLIDKWQKLIENEKKRKAKDLAKPDPKKIKKKPVAPVIQKEKTAQEVEVHREKVRAQLGKSLQEDKIPDSKVNICARVIEKKLFEHWGGANKEYMGQVRTLCNNLKIKENRELRMDIFKGKVRVEQLITMDATALAPKSLKDLRLKQQEEHFKSEVFDQVGPAIEIIDGDGVKRQIRSDGSAMAPESDQEEENDTSKLI